MNRIPLMLLFYFALISCNPKYSVIHREFTGIAGNETSIGWGNTTYRFGANSYEVIVLESYHSSSTIVEQGEYKITNNSISFEPSMKRIYINPDTNSIRGNRIAGGWSYLPMFYADSVNVKFKDTYFKPYNFAVKKEKGYLNIYNPETNRHFTDIRSKQ